MNPILHLPHPSDSGEAVTLNSRGFVVDGVTRQVLRYPVGDSGWTDELTGLHASEDVDGGHYIGVASRQHAVSEVRRVVGECTGAIVLEVGVSSGYFLRDLKAARPDLRLLGADYTDSTLDSLAAAMPDVGFMRFDLTRCPLPEASIDAFVALNVLEHIEDDAAAAKQIARILKPGGGAVIEVPAGPELYDDFDRQLMHFRRYRMAGLVKLFHDAGLTIERKSHLGFFLFPAFWTVKQASKLRGAKPQKSRPKDSVKSAAHLSRLIGPLGHALMLSESVLRHAAPLPFGVRCLITARKAG
jgi:SAM-dependent methyltransferase